MDWEITTPAEINTIVADGQADMVLLARQMIREPYWPLRAAHELGALVEGNDATSAANGMSHVLRPIALALRRT